MTTDQQADSDYSGVIYTLPDLPSLDPRSAIALAVTGELDKQLAGQDVALAINPGPIADAILTALGEGGRFPRIPDWTGDPRTIGGGRPADSAHPEPQITVEPEVDDRGGWRTAHVAFEVEQTCDHAVTAVGRVVVPREDAEQWLLAGLAACRAAGRAPGYPETE